jgi:hypothetical protein
MPLCRLKNKLRITKYMAWKGTKRGAAKDNGMNVRGNETSW